MLHHFKHAINSLLKNKIYTFTNITGLALGLGAAAAITMTLIGMTGIDKFHKNKDVIFKLTHSDDSTSNDYNDASSALLAPAIKEEIPEIVDYCQYMWAEEKILGSPQNYVKETGFYADEGWFRMLSFPLLYGNIDNILSRPDHIALSRKLSEKLFGPVNPVGQTLKLYSYESVQPEQYLISGVFEDITLTSSLRFEFVIPYSCYLNQHPEIQSWNYIGTRSYIQVRPNTNPEMLSRKITRLVRRKHPGMEPRQIFGLAPLTKSNQIFYNLSGKPSFGIYILFAIAIVGISILIISIVNYINLSIATSLQRSKEIGIRKINGAGRKDLVIQFFTETFIVVLLACVIASMVQSYIIKIFMTEPIPIAPFFNKTFVMVVTGMLIFTVIVTAWYPSVYLSRFSPLSIQKNISGGKYKLTFSRRMMITSQFITAIFLITTSVIMSAQVDFLYKKSMGMDRKHIVYFTKNKQLEQHRDAFSQELQEKSGIVSMTYVDQLPNRIGNATTNVYWEGKDPSDKEWFSIINAGENFIQTMRMELIDGRDFSTNDRNKIIINEAAAKKMKMPNCLGNHISILDNNAEIIGIVKNFNFIFMGSPDVPLFIRYAPDNAQIAMIKLEENNEMQGIKALKESFNHFSPDFILDYSFLDQKFNENFAQIKKMKFIMTISAYFSVIIACLGLLGLTVHTSERRIKEIGVRKINGAKLKDLLGILSNQMLKNITTAMLIAFPLVYLINKMILENFAEHIKINILHFIGSIIILFATVAIIVGWQIFRTARKNPVEALRYE